MGLDFTALNQAQDDLVNRTEEGVFLYQKSIGKETDVRILPPYPEMGGKYFLELIIYWIGGKKYISPKTFGLPCPIADEVLEASATKDRTLKALLDNTEKNGYSKRYEYWMPILLLDLSFNTDGTVKTDQIEIKGDARILSTGPQLIKKINKLAVSRKLANGKPDGFTDREKGFNFILSKTGEKLNTEYDAVSDIACELPEKYYKAYPNVVEEAQKELYSDSYLTAAIRNYLYGEAMPKDEDKFEEGAAPVNTGRGSRNPAPEPEANTGRGARNPAPEPEAAPTEEAKAAKQEEPKQEEKAARPARRNILADLDNLGK